MMQPKVNVFKPKNVTSKEKKGKNKINSGSWTEYEDGAGNYEAEKKH